MRLEKEQKRRLNSFIFYEPYNQAIARMDDESAGKFVLRICKFMFNGELDKSDMDESEDFAFSAIEDIVRHSKEMQLMGKEQRGYKSKYRHFTFYELYYKAMKILSMKDSGKFIKVIWSYLFETKEACFESPELNYCFSLCKGKLDLSKKRQTARELNSINTVIRRLSPLDDNKNDAVDMIRPALKNNKDNIVTSVNYASEEDENQMSFVSMITEKEMKIK